MKYKPSKFNYCHQCANGDLLLYNSAVGANSLIRVTPEKVKSVLNILKNDHDGALQDFRILLEKGYIVASGTDEDMLKKLRVMEQVMDSSLHLIILPTEQCNFRCKYCYESFKKGKMSDTSAPITSR